MTESTERLILLEPIREEIIAHAREHAPRECCGVIAGNKLGEITRLYRLTNLEQNTTRYLFDDEEFFRVYWEIENRGEQLLSVYHSHPATVAYPSKTDVEFAFWPEAIYLICSLQFEHAPAIRGFRIVDSMISEVDLG